MAGSLPSDPGVLLCLTVLGIPLGITSFKMGGLALAPFGKQIVPVGPCLRLRALLSTSSVPADEPRKSSVAIGLERGLQVKKASRPYPPRFSLRPARCVQRGNSLTEALLPEMIMQNEELRRASAQLGLLLLGDVRQEPGHDMARSRSLARFSAFLEGVGFVGHDGLECGDERPPLARGGR